MSKTPIDTLFDGVKWVPTGLTESEGDLPVATHEGILHLFDRDFRVYELSNGMRISTGCRTIAEDVEFNRLHSKFLAAFRKAGE